MARRGVRRISPRVVAAAREYRRALRTAGVPVSQVILFGSRAKGTQRRGSDIDLAVVSPDFGRNYDRELSLLMRVRRGVELDIEPHPFHPKDLKDRWSTLAAEIRKYGIPVR